MYKGQQIPMIYICTTLWHEEDFEMATLIRSVLKLMKHAKLRKEKAQNAENFDDNDYFNLEMHIFFDNVFDEQEKRQFRVFAENNPSKASMERRGGNRKS